MVLTGAGLSVASGIPTYRDEAGTWLRSHPIQHSDFIDKHETRQRYWARSMAGWPVISNSKPSKAHFALTELQRLGYVNLIVTQNIDRLHQKSGARNVIDLHGRLDQVICLSCKAVSDRSDLQLQLSDAVNIETAKVMPDGDADVSAEIVGKMIPPTCQCGGFLKPNVVFYGGSVDRNLVDSIYSELTQADGLLVVGSSLQVFSGYRFVRRARDEGIPIASVNPGPTRADEILTLKVTAMADEVIPELTSALKADS